MARWRKKLFALMSRNAQPATAVLQTCRRTASSSWALIPRMRQQGIVRGTCQPSRDSAHGAALSRRAPGYVVRFSEILGLGGGADSVQVYLAATRYRHAPRSPAELLSFERAYRVARAWRVARAQRGEDPEEVVP